MIDRKVVIRYIRALYELAAETSRVDEVARDLAKLDEMLRDQEDLGPHHPHSLHLPDTRRDLYRSHHLLSLQSHPTMRGRRGADLP